MNRPSYFSITWSQEMVVNATPALQMPVVTTSPAPLLGCAGAAAPCIGAAPMQWRCRHALALHAHSHSMQAARVAQLERQRLEQEARDEEEGRRQKQVEDHKKNQAFVRSMMQALDHKRAQADAAMADERRYNAECIKVTLWVQYMPDLTAPVTIATPACLRMHSGSLMSIPGTPSMSASQHWISYWVHADAMEVLLSLGL